MDGARVQKKSGGKPGPAVWVPAAILAVLLAAYLGLCGWVSASDTILPNVTAAGLDLSGMTQAEAEQAINENLSVAQQAGSGWAVDLSCDGYIGTLDGSSFQVDAASLAQASLSVGRGSFFTGGGPVPAPPVRRCPGPWCRSGPTDRGGPYRAGAPAPGR